MCKARPNTQPKAIRGCAFSPYRDRGRDRTMKKEKKRERYTSRQSRMNQRGAYRVEPRLAGRDPRIYSPMSAYKNFSVIRIGCSAWPARGRRPSKAPRLVVLRWGGIGISDVNAYGVRGSESSRRHPRGDSELPLVPRMQDFFLFPLPIGRIAGCAKKLRRHLRTNQQHPGEPRSYSSEVSFFLFFFLFVAPLIRPFTDSPESESVGTRVGSRQERA